MTPRGGWRGTPATGAGSRPSSRGSSASSATGSTLPTTTATSHRSLAVGVEDAPATLTISPTTQMSARGAASHSGVASDEKGAVAAVADSTRLYVCFRDLYSALNVRVRTCDSDAPPPPPTPQL